MEDLSGATPLEVPIADCDKDNIIKFNADYTAKETVNTKCDASDIDNTVTWSLSADGKKITVTENGTDVAVSDIEVLDNDRFVESFDTSVGRGRFTFVH